MKRLIVACSLVVWTPANAQSPVQDWMTQFVGTLSVKSNPYFTEGTLQGCTLVFTTLYQDWTYRKGALLRVDGNIGIMAFSSGQIATNLKVVVNELRFDSPPQAKFSPSAPTRAYLVGPDLQTNLSSLLHNGQSDTPGAIFAVFDVSPTFEMLVQSIDSNALTVAFNNLGGDTDIHMKVELDIADVTETGERKRSPKMKGDFLNCLESLVATRLGEGAKSDRQK
jgi:hypothetical protein